MPKELLNTATQADADLCNAVDPPVLGCPAGAGIQIVFPVDWQARIAAGQLVPGCTYHQTNSGVLFVSDRAAAQLAIPAVVNTLTAPQQLQAAALNTKLQTAQVIP